MNLDDLPRAEFAFPGPLRDQLVAAILSGAKTSTSALVVAYEHLNEPLPTAGQRAAVVDSQDRRVAAIELTEVRVVRLADVDLQHVLDEGEGDESVAQWRAGHESFWQSAAVRAELGDPDFTVNDDTLVLAQRFRLVHVAETSQVPASERERAAMGGLPLKYARVESERRFLVRTIPDGVTRVSDISDRYVDGTRLRLREVTTDEATTRKLGHKVRLGEGPARIAHTSLYLDDAEWAVLCRLPARILRKRRHHVERDGVALAVDQFEDGSLIAEFDGGDVRPADPPAWLDVISEVTGDEAFTGAGRAGASTLP